MREFVVMTLTAPMGAFGDLAGQERRGSAGRPSRSAILGLAGAALGIRRDDACGQRALREWRVAVSVLKEGKPLRDYHTVQTIPSSVVKRPDSRRAALAAARGRENTIVTRRDYRTDVCFGAALWVEEGAPSPVSADGMVAALREPAFFLYLGRSGCPLSAPLSPKAVMAAGPAEALAEINLPPWLTQAGKADPANPLLIASDPTPGFEPDRTERRWNEPIDRERWHFAEREVAIRTGER